MNGLEIILEKIFTFYLSGTKYHTETYDEPFAMIQSVEDLELLLEHLSEEEVHDTPIEELPHVIIDNIECVEIPLSYFRKEGTKRLIKEYDASLNTQQNYEDRHIRDNLIEEVHEETSSEDIFENHPHVTWTENMEDVDKLGEPIEQHIPSDPIEDIDEGPLIEDVI